MRKTSWVAGIAAMIGLSSGLTVFGQQAAAPPTQAGPSNSLELSEIIVTVQKVSEAAQRTPVEVVAFDADQLINQGVIDIRGVSNMVPAAQFQEERGATKVFLRGVGTFLDVDSSDPATATNIDEVYTPREATGGSIYDVKRVEVLYGPQGTLYGRNAAGGAVNVITNDPSTSGFSGDASIEAGNYDLVHATGVLNVPVTSTFALRGAADYQYHSGYLSNGMDDQKAVGARLKALFNPTDSLSFLAAAEYYHNGGNGDTPKYAVPSKEFPSSVDPWEQDTDPRVAGWFRDFDVNKYYGRATFDFGSGISLVYIPAYISYDSNSNFLNGPGSLQIHPEGVQDTQELRLQGTSQSVKWVFGGYWYNFNGDTYSNLTLPPIPAPYPSASTDLNVHSRSWAVFGQATYKVTDQLSLIGGLRYSDDKRSGGGTDYFNLAPGVSFPAPFEADLSSTSVDYHASVQYDVAPNNMVYFTASSGYNQGGFAPTPVGGTAALTFEPMKLHALELGTKNVLFDRRLEINDELYYYNIDNYQVSAFNQALGGLVIVNAQKSEMYGNDLTVRFNATENDHLTLVLGLERARAINFVIPASLVGPGSACNCNGYTLPNAPAATVGATYDHTFVLPGGSNIVANVQTYFTSSYWEVYNHPPQTESPAYTMTNFSLTYNAKGGNWYVSLWGRNLENSDHYGSLSSPASQLTPTTGFIWPPRTYGARVGLHF
jgi:iron complex outermembrane receptor protein